MNRIDPQKEARVWERVKGAQMESSSPEAGIQNLLANEWASASAYLQIARQMEYPDTLYTILDALDALDCNGSVLADEIPQGDGSLPQRHGCSARHGADRPALCLHPSGEDARLRPRRSHGHAPGLCRGAGCPAGRAVQRAADL